MEDYIFDTIHIIKCLMLPKIIYEELKGKMIKYSSEMQSSNEFTCFTIFCCMSLVGGTIKNRPAWECLSVMNVSR